jgi:NAD(P)-dependent dehydrogenase (short-subunit alcohol dehydrogenase family)
MRKAVRTPLIDSLEAILRGSGAALLLVVGSSRAFIPSPTPSSGERGRARERRLTAVAAQQHVRRVDRRRRQPTGEHASARLGEGEGDVLAAVRCWRPRAATATLVKRLPTLDEVADFAAFVASDRAGAITGAVVNLTCGSLVD